MEKGSVVILDAGHGGVINGEYQTKGKRSPEWSQGVLYEGAFNRWLVNRIIEILDRRKIPYYHVSPELTDVPLKVRADRVNKIQANNPKAWCLSIHANAGGGVGIEAFTSKGNTGSDEIAELLLNNLEKYENKMRYDYSDGDKDKEANFYMLNRVTHRSVLLECGFMDNVQDYKRLWNRDYIDELARAISNIITKVYRDEK